MKNELRMLIVLCAALVLFVSVAAASVDVTNVAVSPSSPRDTDTLTCTFTVTGNQASYTANVTWTKNGAAYTADDQVGMTVQNNTATSTSSVGDIESADLSSGDSWACVVTATDGRSKDTMTSAAVSVSAADKLVLTSLSAKCNPSCNDDDLDPKKAVDGDAGTISEVKPGSKLTLTGRVKNEWPDNTKNHDIESVELTCTLEDIGEEDEQEETMDFGDLDPDESSSKETAEYTIAKDAEDGETYSMDCTLSGDDQGGENYDIDFSINVDVEKDKHSVIFDKAELSPASVTCNRKVTVDYKVKNIGSNDEDSVEVTVKNDNLDLFNNEIAGDIPEGDFDDEDTEYSNSFSFTLDKSVASGVYPIRFEVFFDDGDDSTIVLKDLTVGDCVAEQPTPVKNVTVPVKEPVEVITQPTQPVQQPVQPTPKPETEVIEPAFSTDSPYFIAFLALVVLVLLGLGAWMISVIARK
jgi:hypothetical protein